MALAIFVDLGRPYLWDPGEGRYAETVREMLLTGNWLAPTLNFVHYYDKPPGFFWLVAAAFECFGVSEWAARLPAALSALLVIAATVAFAWRRCGPGTALGAGAILATAIQFVVLARSVRMDMVLTLGVSVTLFYAYALWEAPTASGTPGEARRTTWPIYLLPALGVLVKGPVAVLLPALVLGALTVVTGTTRRLASLRPGLGAVVALLVAGSWYLAAAIRAPDYLWVFLWLQNLSRFAASTSGAGHGEPIWFFFWVLPITFLPWTFFLPAALGRAWQRARRGHDLECFLLVWFVVVFAFFTLSRAKLAPYILPAFPPLALLVAGYLGHALRAPAAAQARSFRVPAVLWTAGMLVGILGTVIAAAVRYPDYTLRAAVAVVLLVFPATGIAVIRTQRWRAFPALVLIAALATQMLFYRVGAGIVSEFNSLRTAADAARELPSQARVFAYKTRGHSFTFYDGRVLTRVRSPEAAAAVLRGPEPAALLTKTKYLDRIQRYLSEPACVWWTGPSGRVILTNRAAPDTARHATLPPLPPTNSSAGVLSGPPRC